MTYILIMERDTNHGDETMMTTTVVAISGNTYPVKDQLRALGGRWNPDAKAWMVPAGKADEARALVSGAPAKAPRSSSSTPRRSYARRPDCRRYGWDGVHGSPSYYTSGQYDEES